MADELRKFVMAGFGAVATAVEKAADALNEVTRPEHCERVRTAMDDLAKKGEDAYEKSRTAGNELFSKVGEAFSGLKDMEVEDIRKRMEGLADDALDEVERGIHEIKRLRAQMKDAHAGEDDQDDKGDSDGGSEAPEPHTESGDKPEGAEEEFERATDGETSREDGEDLSEGDTKE